MRRPASMLLFSLGLAAALASGCAADPPPDETTDDGLVRVASRIRRRRVSRAGGTFFQYRRIILEPPSISFIKDWAEKHPEVGPGGNHAHAHGVGPAVSRRVRT